MTLSHMYFMILSHVNFISGYVLEIFGILSSSCSGSGRLRDFAAQHIIPCKVTHQDQDACLFILSVVLL